MKKTSNLHPKLMVDIEAQLNNIANKNWPGLSNRFMRKVMAGHFVAWRWVAGPDSWSVLGFTMKQVYKDSRDD